MKIVPVTIISKPHISLSITPVSVKGVILKKIYRELFKKFGEQHWWPAETRFEVIIGAILTQNTNWVNVEKALANLKKNKYLSPKKLRDISHVELASLIKPAGYFNIKSARIRNFLSFFFSEYRGDLNKMGKEETCVLREKLLTVNGIGPETADSILLYAFDMPVFVIDAYTKRILGRHNIIKQSDDYNMIQNIFMSNLPKDVKMFNEYHALIVRLGKEFCKPRAVCQNCPLRDFV